MMKKMIAAGMAALFAFSTAICGSAITGFAEERNDLKFVYISKQLSHPWFIQEEMGIKKPVRNWGSTATTMMKNVFRISTTHFQWEQMHF